MPASAIVSRLLAAGLLAATTCWMVAPMAKAQTKAPARAERSIERTVSVSASGTVAAVPDVARISTGVVVEADTARDALARNSAAMKKVIDGLKALGVEARDIQTVAFNVEPRYPSRSASGGVAQISGYRVVNQVQIAVRQLDRLGAILDQMIALGANQMSGLSYDVSTAEALKDEARKAAMANAGRRARLLAAAAGAELGDVLVISEDVAHTMPHAMGGRLAMAESVPVEAGSQSLEVRVSVTWALR